MGSSSSIESVISSYEKSLSSVATKVKWQVGLVIKLIGYGTLIVYDITPSNSPPGNLCVSHDSSGRIFIYHYAGPQVIAPNGQAAGVYAMHLRKHHSGDAPIASTMTKFTQAMPAVMSTVMANSNVMPTGMPTGMPTAKSTRRGRGEEDEDLSKLSDDEKAVYDDRIAGIVGDVDEEGVDAIIDDAIKIHGKDEPTDDELLNEIPHGQNNLTVEHRCEAVNVDDPSEDNIANIDINTTDY